MVTKRSYQLESSDRWNLYIPWAQIKDGMAMAVVSLLCSVHPKGLDFYGSSSASS